MTDNKRGVSVNRRVHTRKTNGELQCRAKGPTYGVPGITGIASIGTVRLSSSLS